MALSELLQALMGQEAQAGTGMDALALMRAPAPAPKAKGRAKAPSKTTGVRGIMNIPELPAIDDYRSPQGLENLPGINPAFAHSARSIEKQNTALEKLLASQKAPTDDPRRTAQIKYSEQGMVNPNVLAAVRNITQNAPLPGVEAMRGREAQMQGYIDTLKGEEARYAANPYAKMDFSAIMPQLARMAQVQNTYVAPVDKTEAMQKTRLGFEKELSDLMERRGGIERQQEKDMLGAPITYTSGYGPQPALRAVGQRREDRTAERIGKTLEPLEKMAGIYNSLTSYYNLADKLGNSSGRAFGLGSWGSNPDLETAYAEAQLMAKEAKNLGAAFSPSEQAILARELPSFSSTSATLDKASKLRSIKRYVDVIQAAMGRLKGKAKAMYKNNVGDVEAVYAGASGDLGTINAPAQKAAPSQSINYDWGSVKGKK